MIFNIEDMIFAGLPAAPIIPASPPAEVHDAIEVAATAYQDLALSDRELRFQLDERAGAVTVEVHDLRGHFLYSIPGSTALELASGRHLEPPEP